MSVQRLPSNKYQDSLPKIEQIILSSPSSQWGSIKTKHLAKYFWNIWKNNLELNSALKHLCVRTLYFFSSIRCSHLSKKPKWQSRIEEIFKNVNFRNIESLVDLLNLSSEGNIHLYKLLCTHISPEVVPQLRGLKDLPLLLFECGKAHEIPDCFTYLKEQGIPLKKAKEIIWQKACVLGRLDILMELVDKFSFSPHYVDQDQAHAIHHAACFGHTNIIIHCLANKWCLIDSPDSLGNTALHLACKNGHKETVELLIKNGSNLQAINKKGATAFHFACRSGKVKLVQLLLENGTIKPDCKTSTGSTGVHFACMQSNVKLLKFLVQDCHLSHHEKNKFEETPLHVAINYDQSEIAEVLVREYQTDPNAQNQCGNTPLHLACQNGNLKLVQVLLTCPHIDLLCLNNLRLTAFDAAVSKMMELQSKRTSLQTEAIFGAFLSEASVIEYNNYQIQNIKNQIEKQKAILDRITQNSLEKAENSFNAIYTNISSEIVTNYFISIGLIATVLSSTNPQNPYYLLLLKKCIKLLSILYSKDLKLKILQAFEDELSELDKQLENSTRLLIILKKLKEIKNLIFTFKYACKLTSAYVEDDLAKIFTSFEERLSRLTEKCQSKINIINPQNSYDEQDVFSILAQEFGIGIADEAFRASAEDSYLNYLGVEGPRIYECGITEGRDLRALGISPDFRLAILKILELKDLQDLITTCKNANDLFKNFIVQMEALPAALHEKFKTFQMSGEGIFQNIYQFLNEKRPFSEIEEQLRKLIESDKSFKLFLLKSYLIQSQQLPIIISSYVSSGNAQISQLNLPIGTLYSLQMANRGIKREAPTMSQHGRPK